MLHSLVLQPMLSCMEAEWNWCLPEGQVAKYDTTDLLHSDVDAWYETVAMLKEKGVITENEARSWLRRGLEPKEGGDELRRPSAAPATFGADPAAEPGEMDDG